MFFIEDLAALVLWLIALVVSLNLVFFFFVLYRRFSRQRFYAEKDAARERYQELILEFRDGKIDVEKAANLLSMATTKAERDAVHEMLSAIADPKRLEDVSVLLFALAYADEWASTAFGKPRGKQLIERTFKRDTGARGSRQGARLPRFIARLRLFAVPRAIAVGRLGRLLPRFAQPFLTEALKDPAADVRRVAVEAMGRNRSPEGIPLLVAELQKAVDEKNDISLRTMKSALISYRLEDLEHFIPFLTGKSRRGRFFVIDTVREICERSGKGTRLNKNDFPPELYRVVLENCVIDEFEDVRARSAYVVKHFRDRLAIDALKTLLRDENEFVRLHAVRACSDRHFTELVPDVVSRLTDVRWRVREAAVTSLKNMGPQGREELYRFFVGCTDKFASEQISEELQRGGLIQDVVATITEGGDAAFLAQSVADKLSALGKQSVLLSMLATRQSSSFAAIALMDSLSTNPTGEYVSVLHNLAQSADSQVQVKAKQVLRRLSGSGSGIISAASASGTGSGSGS